MRKLFWLSLKILIFSFLDPSRKTFLWLILRQPWNYIFFILGKKKKVLNSAEYILLFPTPTPHPFVPVFIGFLTLRLTIWTLRTYLWTWETQDHFSWYTPSCLGNRQSSHKEWYHFHLSVRNRCTCSLFWEICRGSILC